MRRGDVVTIADRQGGDRGGKPRPAVIVQSDHFADAPSVVVCPMTSIELAAPLARLRVEPGESLPLREVSWVMVDKITAVRRAKVGGVIGRLPREAMVALDRALVVFLGIA